MIDSIPASHAHACRRMGSSTDHPVHQANSAQTVGLSGLRFGEYDYVLINSSGGKDSQAMLWVLADQAARQAFPRERMIVVHADLGRMEWPGTRVLAERQAALCGLPFEVVQRPGGDLLTHVEQRGKWPSARARFCTSDHKTAPSGGS